MRFFKVNVNYVKCDYNYYVYQQMKIKRIKLQVIYIHQLSYIFQRRWRIFAETCRRVFV